MKTLSVYISSVGNDDRMVSSWPRSSIMRVLSPGSCQADASLELLFFLNHRGGDLVALTSIYHARTSGLQAAKRLSGEEP